MIFPEAYMLDTTCGPYGLRGEDHCLWAIAIEYTAVKKNFFSVETMS